MKVTPKKATVACDPVPDMLRIVKSFQNLQDGLNVALDFLVV